VAGDEVAAWLRSAGAAPAPDEAAIAAAIARCEGPLARRGGDLNALRESLQTLMWDDVGIVRSRTSLGRALDALDAIEDELAATGVPGDTRAFNLAWHEWLNLDSLVAVSRVVARAALARDDSRGAHFREDFPQTGDPARSAYTRTVLSDDGAVRIEFVPVEFTRVRPGETLV
ncbi:MAG TPA: succinate dehydrogenase/fumarate reductase flavoprotein subunit, partial [Casimicrobiaceae bacterium]